MKTTVKLNESDLRKILAERFGCDPATIRLHYAAAEQDGPHYSPASMSAELDIDDRPVIAQQTVVQGGAVFGPTTIVMPSRR